MKVVLFCGGLGTRLREHSDTIPKPLVTIGPRPIIWHLMTYYSSYGYNDFVLCLGYGGEQIRDYFLSYNPYSSTDFWIDFRTGEKQVDWDPAKDWKITFVDTGLHSNIGQRLLAVRELLGQDSEFLANYSDGLSDLNLETHVEAFRKSGSIARFAAVKPAQSFHSISISDGGVVTGISPIADSGVRINGGFFVMRTEIFDFMKFGEELVEQPFQRLVREQKLSACNHDGFWAAMDTFKDKISFERMWAQGERPWLRVIDRSDRK